MNYNFEIQKILLTVDKLSNVEDKIRELKQAVNIADVNNDVEWGYDLRNLIIRNEGMLIGRKESFPAFAWILNASDNNPDLFDENEILLDYTWMASIAFCDSSVSKQQIDYILNDYKNRLQKTGFSNRTYYELLVDWYLFVGDGANARNSAELRDKEPLDELFHGTESMTDICVELLNGNLDKGISMSQDYVSRNTGNKNNIFNVYNQLIYYLNKARDKRTSIFFEKSDAIFSELEKSPYLLFELCLMMYYMSRYEQEKAWLYFEQYAEWEIAANDYSSFDFSLSILPLFKKEEIRELKFSPKIPFFRQDNKYNTRELYNYYYNKANDLAQKFDCRNENNYFSDQIKWHLED